MKISFISFNSTSASALYPFQMLVSLVESGQCELQVIVAKRAYNIENYRQICKIYNIELHEFETYEHNNRAVLKSFFRFCRFRKIIKTISKYCPDAIYFPFKCVWAPILFPCFNHIAPVICTLHDPYPHDESKGIIEYMYRRSGDWALKRTSGLIVLNSKDAQYVRKKYGKYVTIIPHAAFSFYSKLAKGVDVSVIKHQICFVGRIEPYKGVDLLVEAMQRVKSKDIKLVIAGGGSIREETMTKIAKSKNIQLINRFVPDEEMVDIIENSDFIVLPYLRASQSGVIPMSYALGRTVIATHVGALDEQVKEGTGMLVNPNVESVANAIDEMYSNEMQIIKMSKRAKEFADTELTWEHSADLLIDCIKAVKRNEQDFDNYK